MTGRPRFEPSFEPTPGAPDRYQPGAPRALIEAATAYFRTVKWTYARTMPRIPHQYAIREKSQAVGLGNGHEALYVLIRDYHYDRWWGRRTWRTIDLGGFAVWIIDDGQAINRRPVDKAGWREPPTPEQREQQRRASPPPLFDAP